MGCVFFIIAEMLLKLAININQSINQSIIIKHTNTA